MVLPGQKEMNKNGSSSNRANEKKVKKQMFATEGLIKNKMAPCFCMSAFLHFEMKPHTKPPISGKLHSTED